MNEITFLDGKAVYTKYGQWGGGWGGGRLDKSLHLSPVFITGAGGGGGGGGGGGWGDGGGGGTGQITTFFTCLYCYI